MDSTGTAAHSERYGTVGAGVERASSRSPGQGSSSRPADYVESGKTTATELGRSADAAAVGDTLRRARLSQRLTLGQVSSATRIQTAYLEAVEDDDYSLLPSPLHARAFVRSYARYLELPDAEALVALYDRQRSPRAPHRVDRPSSQGRRSSWPWLIGAGTALALGVLTLVLLVGPAVNWPLQSILAPSGLTSDAPPTGLRDNLAGIGLDAPLQPGVAHTGDAAPPSSAVVVRAEAREGVWVRVTIDGQLAQEGLLAAGERATWSGNRSVRIRSGNARALSLVVNDQAFGPLGARDEVIERTFSPAQAE